MTGSKTAHDRPLLAQNKTPEYIRELLEKREPYYKRAADLEVIYGLEGLQGRLQKR